MLFAPLTLSPFAQFATEQQAAAKSVRPMTLHAVDVPWDPAAGLPLPDPRPYAAVARSNPDGVASLPPGMALHEVGKIA